MIKFNKKLPLTAMVIIMSLLTYAQPGGSTGPPCPTGDCGVGGTNPGAPASPIDNYIYLLLIVAIVLIIYFIKKEAKYKANKKHLI